jgi:hypothetical protein
MVAVGDHDRLGSHGVGDGVAHAGVVDYPHRVAHALAVVDVGHRFGVHREQVGEPLGQRQSPDGGEVGAARPQQLEPVAAGLGGRALVGEDVAPRGAKGQGPDHPGGVAVDTGVVGVGHPVDGERRSPVPHEHAVGLPTREQAAGNLVAILAALVDGQVDPHGVVRAAARELCALALVDHVVGRADDVAERHPREVVADAGKRLEAGHGPILADRPRPGPNLEPMARGAAG